jgi:hypothetical protein
VCYEEAGNQKSLTLAPLRIEEDDDSHAHTQHRHISDLSSDESGTRIESEYPRSIFPSFLNSASFMQDMQQVKASIGQVGREKGYTPLLPIHVSKRLLGNCFDDITRGYPIMKRSHILSLLEAQHRASPAGPGVEPATWAVVNAFLAVALRSKIASGSETALFPIAKAYYDNATMVLHDLILGEPTLLSVQALLAMALFARSESATWPVIMLVSNASRLLDLCERARPEMCFATNGEAEGYDHLRRITETFEYAAEATVR